MPKVGDFQRYKWSLGFALLLHLILFGGVSGYFISTKKLVKQPKPIPEIINATVYNENQIDAFISNIKQQRLDQQQAEQNRKQQQEKKRKQEQKKREQRRLNKIKAEEKAKADALAEKKAAKLKKKKVAEDAKLKKLEAEKKRKADIKRKAEAKKLKAEEKKRKTEEKKRLEAKRKKQEQAKRDQEAKRKQEQARQLEAKQKAEANAKEQARIAGENKRRTTTAINRAITLITRKVTNNWIRPKSIGKGLICTLRVRLLPGGVVIDARVVKGSGNIIFDRSAENAVRKASPLPVPKDSELFDYFRTFTFNFKPQ